jgi:P4 family phage/plasmid primase-like protien
MTTPTPWNSGQQQNTGQGGPPAGQGVNGHDDMPPQVLAGPVPIPLTTDEERLQPGIAPAGTPVWLTAGKILNHGVQPADIARTLARMSLGRLMWDPKYGDWYAWTGTHWRVSDEGWEDQHIQARRLRDSARKVAGQVADGLDDSANDMAGDPPGGGTPDEVLAYKRDVITDRVGTVVKKLSTRSMQRDILGQVASHQGIMIRLEEHQGRRNVLNFANCTAALDADAWWEHNPADLITHCLPWNYNPQAACPQFLHLVWKMTGPDGDQSPAHRELYEFVLSVLGYCLIYGNPAQLVFFLTGPTKTGKTTVVEIVAELLGEQLAHKSKPVLVTVSRSGDTHDSVRYSIRGRRLVYVDETEAKMRIDVSALKDLSGAGSVPVRKMRGSTEVPTPVTWAMVIPTNQMPSMVGGDDSVAERLVQILCGGETIPVEQRDPGLKAKIIAAEAEGILALLAGYARQYYTRGLSQPEAVRAASAKYMAAQDTVGGFRADQCTAVPLPRQQYAWAVRSELFAAYEDWCGGRGKGLGRNEFYEAMRDQPGVGETKDGRGLDIFTGIRLGQPYG